MKTNSCLYITACRSKSDRLLVVAGRGIPFFSLSVPKGEIKGRQRALEMSMEYALAAMRRPEQILYILVGRGFAGLDYLGPSEL